MKRWMVFAATALLAGIGFHTLAQPPQGGPPGSRPGALGQGPGQGGPGQGGPGQGSPPNPLLELLDKNADGELSQDEIAGVVGALKALDGDKDGKIVEQELPPPPLGFGRGGPGGPGGPGGQEQRLVKKFDVDKDGVLNRKERDAARKSMTENGGGSVRGGRGGPGRGGRGGPGRGGPGRGGPGRGGPGGGVAQNTPKPGPRVDPKNVSSYPTRKLYDESIVRTLFIDFAEDDWEDELAAFYRTDVDVPAKLTVDGKTYPNVGVAFRGNSSFFSLSKGQKRSFNLTMDLVDGDQHLYGYRTLNLLNGHADPSFLRTVLYNHIARNYVPAPKSNFVQVVVNGESWGLFINDQQFNKDFTSDWFAERNGVRWKMPAGRGERSLNYAGPDKQAYGSYQLKSAENERAWKDLIELCRLIEETPADKLDGELDSVLNLDRVLWFLAVDNALLDMDGYHARGSDYVMYQEARSGRFHVLPYDSNEVFRNAGGGRGPGGPGFGFGPPGFGIPGFGPPGGGPPGGGGNTSPFGLDPLAGADNPARPLLNKLLANPRLKARYLAHLKTVADDWVNWKKIGPLIQQMHDLIDPHVKADTRRLYTYEAFQSSIGDFAGGGRNAPGLRAFFDGRHKYLTGHKTLAPQAKIANVVARQQGRAATTTAAPRLPITVLAGDGKSLDAKYVLHFATEAGGLFQPIDMHDDGEHDDGKAADGRFGARIPAQLAGVQLSYYVEVRAANGAAAFEPSRAESGPRRLSIESENSPIRLAINEVLPANKSSVADHDGEFDDWIEIVNLSKETIDLAGRYLSDDKRQPRKWRFPSGSLVPPGEYLVVWADNDVRQSGLHANFKLSQQGEELYLFDTDANDNRQLDEVAWSKLPADVSLGRSKTDPRKWEAMTPTPGKVNSK